MTWAVEIYGTGWEPLADQMATEEDAQSLLESVATHRALGDLGMRVVKVDDYCPTCSREGHEMCSMKAGCPCCDDTMANIALREGDAK